MKREKKIFLRVVAKPTFGFGCGALTYCTVRIKIRKKWLVMIMTQFGGK
jgi:hypothetical protein